MATVGARRRGLPVAEWAAVLGGLTAALFGGFLVADYGLSAAFFVGAIAVGLLVLRWPFVGLLALVGSIAIENVFVVEGAGRAVTGSRLAGIMVFGAWILGKLLRRESFLPLATSALTITAALFFAFALASTLWARYPDVALSEAVRLAQFIALGLITFDLARSWERIDLLVKVMVIGASAAAMLTIHQATTGAGGRAGDNISGGINQTASVLVTMVPFAFYLLRSRHRAAWRVLGISYIALAVAAVPLTYSRMNLLLLPIILTVLTLHTVLGRRGRVPILAATVAAIGVAFYVVPTERLEARLATVVPYLGKTLGSADRGIVEYSDRGYHLRLGLAIARDEPVIGAGFNNYGHLFRDEYQYLVPGSGRVYYSARNPHSSHVGMLADLGGIGFGLWIALLLGAGVIPAMRSWWRAAFDHEGTPYLVAQAITYALGMQVFVYGWYSSTDKTKLLWVLLGLAVAAWALVSRVSANSVPDALGNDARSKGSNRKRMTESALVKRGMT